MAKKLKTGDDYIEYAKRAGAKVEPAGMKKGQEFTKISTPRGSMFLTPGKQPLDPRTRKSYTHWLRLLGLLILVLGVLAVIDFTVGLIPLWNALT